MERPALEDVDVVVATIIPETELAALQASFGIDPGSDHDEAVQDNYIWLTAVDNSEYGTLTVAIVCLPKGVLAAQNATQAILGPTSSLSPDLALLVGTAGGRDRTSNGDLVVSTDGVVYYEPESDDVRPDWEYLERPLKREVEVQFNSRQMKELGLLDEYEASLTALETATSEIDVADEARSVDPSISYKAVASGEKILDDTTLEDVAAGKGQVYAAEMEGFGFARACASNECDWLVVRSISDRGDRDERKAWALPAAAMASSFAKLYLQHADVPFESDDEEQEVEPESLYSRKKIPDLMAEKLQRDHGIDISSVDFDLELTINDLERICDISHGDKSRDDIRAKLRKARSYAYEEKYGKRSKDEDERFTVIGFEQWKGEFQNTLADAGISNMRGDDVLVVGVGNGREVEAFFSGADTITGVDISQEMLDTTASRFQDLQLYQCNAENLACIESSSKDVYISLRTFQSTLLDVKEAIFEAGRVLRTGGTIVLSVPYIFYNSERDEVVQGLLRSPNSDKLDPHLPYEVADDIRRILDRFMFDDVKIRTGGVEIYVYGQRQ